LLPGNFEAAIGVYRIKQETDGSSLQESGAAAMRSSLSGVALAILFLPVSLSASEPKYTDARNDGLLGPIRSVSTREERAQIEWHQPDGPTVALPASCQECEYDLEGNRIRTGQIIDGEFRGDVIRLLRDNTGKVIEKIVENYKGEMYRREVIGPYGITEQAGFENGKQISRSLWFYDGNGHVSEYRNYDRDGVIVGSSFSTIDANDNFKEEWDSGPNGSFSLHFVQTNDPKTDTFTFTNFNENGSIKVTFSTMGTKVISYWQEPSEPQVFGSNFFMDPVGKTQESYSCYSDGSCDHVVSNFLDEARHHVSRIEWRDAAGVLKLSGDYEYDLDQFGNWTKRTVWVWSPEIGNRKLYETDYRTLTYWRTIGGSKGGR
jgi:hypothetical protein